MHRLQLKTTHAMTPMEESKIGYLLGILFIALLFCAVTERLVASGSIRALNAETRSSVLSAMPK